MRMKNVGNIKHSSLSSQTEARCKGHISKSNWKIHSYDLRMFWLDGRNIGLILQGGTRRQKALQSVSNWHWASQNERHGLVERLLLYGGKVGSNRQPRSRIGVGHCQRSCSRSEA